MSLKGISLFVLVSMALVLETFIILVNGIDRLAPGEEKISDKGFAVNQSGDPNQLQTTIMGTWEDSKGMKYSGDFNLNFADPDLPPADGS